MSISHAILGMLCLQPMSGYDIKKAMQGISFMHWSGNNNQVYTALLNLLEEGYATSESKYQESLPSKKIYTITGKGLDELKAWTASPPEPAEFKKEFLVQLAFADLLDDGALEGLLAKYEEEVGLRLVMAREKQRRGSGFVSRTERETFLWRMVDENVLSSWRTELEWIKNVRKNLPKRVEKEENEQMKYAIVENGKTRYIEVFSSNPPIGTESEALELVALCGEHDTMRLMLHEEALAADFFKLRTCVAGDIMQKFVNYHIKAAVIVQDPAGLGARFRELITETNKGRQYGVFTGKQQAEVWLMKEN